MEQDSEDGEIDVVRTALDMLLCRKRKDVELMKNRYTIRKKSPGYNFIDSICKAS